MADQVMAYIRSDPSGLFPAYNEPQLTAIRSALTCRLTQVGGRFYGNRVGGTLEANVGADTALEAQGGGHCYVDRGTREGMTAPWRGCSV